MTFEEYLTQSLQYQSANVSSKKHQGIIYINSNNFVIILFYRLLKIF